MHTLYPGRFSRRRFLRGVTLAPERDTPDALRQYAENFGEDLHGWRF
jgi:cytochrome oxidase Cu insertion factor (SCO1/SenC/PrrC family)